MISNQKFSESVEKIYTAVDDVLKNLEDAPEKHKKAAALSKPYFSACFKALENFHDKDSKESGDREALLGQLNKAKDDYCEKVLGKDRSTSSQLVRYILKAVVNFIAA